jgi:membrane-bound serine protease (ClpP class)
MAEKFVTENVALDEKEALEKGCIEVVASNLSSLLDEINGMVVKGRKINTSDAEIIEIKWGVREKIINYLTDPSIASLLLTIGLFGLIIGFFTPTFHLPETIGAIFIVLALYGLSYIGINAAGILLIILGIIFMIIEAHTPTFGFWTAMAIISLIFGIMLIPSSHSIHEMPEGWYISFRLGSILIIVIVATFFAYALYKVSKAKKLKPRIGYGDLIGQKGIAITDLNPKGQVKVRGEIWNAEADENVKKGEEIIVVAQERLKLKVRKA